jgi:TrwC relaxase
MLTIRAMSDGKGYSSRHLEHSDYYAEGERVTGVWQGRAAELLGLSGPVKTEEFEVDLSPFLTQAVKTQNPFKGELSHGVVEKDIH